MRISDWSSDVCSSDLSHGHEESCEETSRQEGGEEIGPQDREEGSSQVVRPQGRQEGRQASGEEGHQEGSEEEGRSEEHTSELQSLMRISYAVFCLKKKRTEQNTRIKSS